MMKKHLKKIPPDTWVFMFVCVIGILLALVYIVGLQKFNTAEHKYVWGQPVMGMVGVVLAATLAVIFAADFVLNLSLKGSLRSRRQLATASGAIMCVGVAVSILEICICLIHPIAEDYVNFLIIVYYVVNGSAMLLLIVMTMNRIALISWYEAKKETSGREEAPSNGK